MIPQIYTDKCNEILKYCEKMSIPVVKEVGVSDWVSEFLYMWDIRWDGASLMHSDKEALCIKERRKPSLKSSGTYYVHPDVFMEQLKKIREERYTTMKTADLLKAAEDAFKPKMRVGLDPDFEVKLKARSHSSFKDEMEKWSRLFAEQPAVPQGVLEATPYTFSGEYREGDTVMPLPMQKEWANDGPGFSPNMERYAYCLAHVTRVKLRYDGRKQYELDICPNYWWLGTWLVGIANASIEKPTKQSTIERMMQELKEKQDEAHKELENKTNKDDDTITIELPTLKPLKIQL